MTIAMRPSKIARAAGTGASVPVECCQVCGHAPLETVLSLGYMPPVNQMVPIGEVPAPATMVPDHAAALPELRTRTAGPCRRSGHHFPAGISLHQRHDQAPARQLCRPTARERGHVRALATRISSSISGRMTARYCRISKMAVSACSGSSRRTSATLPTSAASRRSSATSDRTRHAR